MNDIRTLVFLRFEANIETHLGKLSAGLPSTKKIHRTKGKQIRNSMTLRSENYPYRMMHYSPSPSFFQIHRIDNIKY